MKILNNKIEYEKGEPAMRSCWECNPAHKHLKNTEFLHWCFSCGRHWIYGRYLDSFKTDKAIIKFIRRKIMNKPTLIDSKPCKICHIVKPFTEFSKDSQVKSGISNRCKTCDKEKNKKRHYTGYTWKDIQQLTTSPEEEFRDLYGKVDVKHKGKWVMKKGKVLDDKWYQRKLRRLEKGRKG